jgi:hypothetical protein
MFFGWYFVLSSSIMMSIKRILLFILLLVVGLLIFSLVQLMLGPENPIQTGLNLFYYFSVLLALVGLRVSLIGSQRVHPAVLVLTLLITGLLTWEWMNPQSVLSLGHVSLGLFSLQLGLVLMLLVKIDGKGSKLVQLIIALTTLTISCMAFLKMEHEWVYSIGGGLLALTSISTLVFLFSRKAS